MGRDLAALIVAIAGIVAAFAAVPKSKSRGVCIVACAVLLVVAMGVFFSERFEAAPSLVEAVPSATQSETSSQAKPKSDPPVAILRRVFLTPRGKVYCATFLKSDRMGCVITDHDYPPHSASCSYLTILGRTGQATVKPCAGEDDLGEMYGTPPSLTATLNDYGIVDMGAASCEINHDYTTCSNEDGHGFTLTGKAHDTF